MIPNFQVVVVAIVDVHSTFKMTPYELALSPTKTFSSSLVISMTPMWTGLKSKKKLPEAQQTQ